MCAHPSQSQHISPEHHCSLPQRRHYTSPYVPFKLLTFHLFIAWVPFQFIHCCNRTINLPKPSPELSNYLNQPIKWNDCWRGCCIAWWTNSFFQAHRRNSELSDTTHHSGAVVGGGGSYCIRRSYKAWWIDNSCSPRKIMTCEGGTGEVEARRREKLRIFKSEGMKYTFWVFSFFNPVFWV